MALCVTTAFLSATLPTALRADDPAPPPLAGTVDVRSDSPSGLREEQPVGAYNQPQWVKHRRFATTRVHIQRDPWEVGYEQWWRGRLNSGEWSHRVQEEIEIGLPGRIQLDLYHTWTIEESRADHLDISAEVRWGLADWGVIPLNPALYFEYKWTDPSRGGDVIEPKLLLGDDFGDGWHWGLNLVYERELTGEKAEEYQITQGFSHSIIDEILSAGVEMKYVRETVAGERGHPEHKFLLGPSIQWRPRRNIHLDLVALAGLTNDSPDLESWFIFGIDFGGSGEKHAEAPISGRR